MQCQSAICQLVSHKPVHSSKLTSNTQVSFYDVKPYHNSALNKFMIRYCSMAVQAPGRSLGLIFAGYVQQACQKPYPIIVYSVAKQ